MRPRFYPQLRFFWVDNGVSVMHDIRIKGLDSSRLFAIGDMELILREIDFEGIIMGYLGRIRVSQERYDNWKSNYSVLMTSRRSTI